MQKETKFKEKVISRLRSIKGIWFVKVQQVAVRGTPDIIGCYQGKFFAWELKVLGNKPTQLQQFTLDKITQASGIARTVYPETLDECMEELIGSSKVL